VILVVATGLLGCAVPVDSPTATIEMSRMATLRGVGDSVDLASGRPAIGLSGFIAAPILDGSSGGVAVFDSAGRYLKSVGRSGGGPGEFTLVTTIGFGPGDSLWVVDGFFRAQVFSPPPELQFVRLVQSDHALAGWVTRYGLLSAGMLVRSGYQPPRLFDWNGTRLAQFGPAQPAGNAEHRMGPIDPVDATRVWAALSNEYVVELLGADGAIHGTVRREVDWFPADSTAPSYPWIERPRPAITAVGTDADGHLWVLVRRAHRDWEKNRRGAPQTTGPMRVGDLMAIPVNGLFEGVLDVFDMSSGRLLASREVSGGVRGFAARSVVYEVVENDSGEVTIQLWRLSIK